MNVNPGHRYNKLTNSEFLHKLGVLVNSKVTLGGLLVFGTEDLLMETITNYRIEYLEISGISYEDAPTRYNFRISSEQNLWTTFFDIYERFPKKIDIPFKMVSGFRDDNPEHLQALREALVNLIIHTDYFSRANPRIRVFSDRFEFFNPGSLPKKIEYILEEDFSLPRNPIIAKIFRFIRLAESIGSGFHKMIEGWEQHYGIKPAIEGDFDYYKITFPTVTEKVPKKLGVKLGDKLGVKLGENEIKIIELMKENKYITTKELSEYIKISTTAVDNNITKLKKKGVLKRIGSPKGGHWEVIEK